jgi:hypothetical protein
MLLYYKKKYQKKNTRVSVMKMYEYSIFTIHSRAILTNFRRQFFKFIYHGTIGPDIKLEYNRKCGNGSIVMFYVAVEIIIL